MERKQLSPLTRARVLFGVPQHVLAKKIGKSQFWLSFVERGKIKPKLSDQRKLAKALETDLATLGFEDE